jgi:16S rRNA U516 pseudouridylate synthase RsuA-like enzyme
LRLIRWAVGPYTLTDLAPGMWRRVDTPQFVATNVNSAQGSCVRRRRS